MINVWCLVVQNKRLAGVILDGLLSWCSVVSNQRLASGSLDWLMLVYNNFSMLLSSNHGIQACCSFQR